MFNVHLTGIAGFIFTAAITAVMTFLLFVGLLIAFSIIFDWYQWAWYRIKMSKDFKKSWAFFLVNRERIEALMKKETEDGSDTE